MQWLYAKASQSPKRPLELKRSGTRGLSDSRSLYISTAKYRQNPGPTRPDSDPIRYKIRIGFGILSEYFKRANLLLYL
jgi:hypothetical protein